MPLLHIHRTISHLHVLPIDFKYALVFRSCSERNNFKSIAHLQEILKTELIKFPILHSLMATRKSCRWCQREGQRCVSHRELDESLGKKSRKQIIPEVLTQFNRSMSNTEEQSIHGDVKPHTTCEMCKKKFPWGERINKHLEEGPVKTYCCQLCCDADLVNRQKLDITWLKKHNHCLRQRIEKAIPSRWTTEVSRNFGQPEPCSKCSKTTDEEAWYNVCESSLKVYAYCSEECEKNDTERRLTDEVKYLTEELGFIRSEVFTAYCYIKTNDERELYVRRKRIVVKK